MNSECPLCEREHKSTRWFYVVECDTCNVPMVVAPNHKSDFADGEKDDIRRLFGDKYKIRWRMRDIPEHAHCHLEEK